MEELQPVVDAPQPAPGWTQLSECQVCGRQPTRPFTYRANAGFLIVRQSYTFEGNLCKHCAVGTYRAYQARNIARGPWGFISFFAAILYLVTNFGAVRGARAMDPPMSYHPISDGELRGRPVFLRPTVLVALAVVACVFAYSLTDVEGGTEVAADWSTGSCIGEVGEPDLVIPVECGSGHTIGWVATTVASPASCPTATEMYVDVTPTEVACIYLR